MLKLYLEMLNGQFEFIQIGIESFGSIMDHGLEKYESSQNHLYMDQFTV